MGSFVRHLSFGNNELWRFSCNTMRCLGGNCRSLATSSISLFPRQTSDLTKSGSGASKNKRDLKKESISSGRTDGDKVDLNLRFKYPEMFPEPFMIWRNPIKEKLERKDMLSRRSQIYIPEFYVGSILRVTLSNFHQADKVSTFVGICIQREESGLRAYFILRNVIDNLGVEVKLELYDPRLLKIEVLRLERRLDKHLRYLRDALPEYSTFPFDMKADVRRSEEVPINRVKVKLNPKPWTEHWHKYDYKGIENLDELMTNKMRVKRERVMKPWEKYDLMKEYRATIPEEEIEEILTEIKDDVEEHDRKHRRRQV